MTLTSLELRTKITRSGELELSLAEVPVPAPGPDQVVIRIEAAPIAPSDLALLLGPADLAAATAGGTPERPVVTAPVPQGAMGAMAARLDQSLRAGNEGAGTVVDAGDSAKELIGKTVSVVGGAMFAQYIVVPARGCFVLPDGTTPAQGAAAFVNPMTVLAMLETMRRDGHKALVHTAAASSLGQMLVKACATDGVPLVNIVRSADQVKLLRDLGAAHVLDSTSATFRADLVAAVAETKATLAFDAISGGPLAGQILGAMEIAASKQATSYSRYGTDVFKQVYVYGRLDLKPMTLDASAGFAWSVTGWLVSNVLAKVGMETVMKMRARVGAELTTTFASQYTQTIGLAEMLQLDVLRAYAKRATGAKYLLDPTRGTK